MTSTDHSPVVESAADLIGERARQRIAARLLPFLFLMYLTNYLDRTSVAYAAVGMTSDLGFSDRVFGLAAGIFFLSYVALQIPGAMLVERWGARRVISVIMLTWGLLTALTGLVHTSVQLYLARLILGFAEAAFFPGVIVYLGHWFVRKDRAKAIAYFMAAIPVSQALAAPVAGWIIGHAFFGWAGWRWLFIFEGLPAVVLSVAAYFFLNSSPRRAGWLAPSQRDWITRTLAREAEDAPKAQSVVQTLRSTLVLLLALVTFLSYFVGYGFYFWFPTMLQRQSGLSGARLGLTGAIPYLFTLVAMLVNGWHSDKKMERRWHAAVPMFGAALGAAGLCVGAHSLPVLVLLFTLIACANAFLPAFWPLPTALLSGSAAAAAVGLINAAGSIAGFASPYLLGDLSTRTGSFSSGMAVVAAVGVVGGLLIFRIPQNAGGVRG